MSGEPARGVLVTAATTPVGRRLVETLGADPRIGSVLAVSAEAVDADTRTVRWVQCDLTRYRDVHRLLHETAVQLRIDSIVHTPLHRSAVDTGRHVWELNVETTRTLLALAEEQPTLDRFVLRSFSDVYRIAAGLPTIVDEQHPLDLSEHAPQRTRDRIEADMTVCARAGGSRLRIVVLRCAELVAPASGSQLYDYLGSRVCVRPLGFDPVINVLSLDDAVRATSLALFASESGAFNVPGLDVLPLSEVVQKVGRVGVVLPGPVLGSLYRLRTRVLGTEFAYAANRARLLFGGVLDGRRARRALGYVPEIGVDWNALAGALRDSSGSRHEPA